ncbi:MAG TPA: SRPBCC family protein [Pseudolabrys sp.]|nr:SRPBCC family protein [Pseudolabrys sp.]
MAFPLTSTQTLTTAASPTAMWRAFERVDLWPTALPALLTARLEPPGPLAAGQRIVTRATAESRSADLSYEVVAAEAPHRLVLAIDDPAYRATTEYRIVPEKAGSDVIVTSTLEAVGLMQTLRFVLWQQRLTPMLAGTARERTQAFIALAERIGDKD